VSHNCCHPDCDLKLEAHSVKLNRDQQVRILSELLIMCFKNCNDFDVLEFSLSNLSEITYKLIFCYLNPALIATILPICIFS